MVKVFELVLRHKSAIIRPRSFRVSTLKLSGIFPECYRQSGWTQFTYLRITNDV